MTEWWTNLSWSQAALVLCALAMVTLALIVAIFTEEP